MFGEELLSALIGDIYDAALSATQWASALAKIAGFVGGSSSSLYWKDAASKHGSVSFDDGNFDPYYRQLYFEKFIKLDPTTTTLCLAEIGEPVSTSDLIPYDEFLETRFYKEWVRPQGWVDCVNTVLDRSAASAALCAVFRNARDGIVDDETRKRMRLLAPHIRRAVLIGRAIDLTSAEAASFADTLDAIRAAIFLVNAKAQIVHANAAGWAVLEEGDCLRAQNSKLAACCESETQALIDAALSAGAGDVALGGQGIAVPLTARDGGRYVAHALPLTSGARRGTGKTYAAVAALFVHPAGLTSPSPLELIAKTYRLDARPSFASCSPSLRSAACPTSLTAFGIAESTVKTHLGRLYEKTGTYRQADLVKLVAGFSSSLVR